MTQQVIFKMNEEDFGMDIMMVKEILRMQSLTAMPNTTSYVLGVTNIRGQVVPIISLKNILKIEEVEDNENTRIIVVGSGEKIYGFKVDAVSEIIKIDEEEIEEPGKMNVDEEKNFIMGIAKLGERLVKLVDLEKILQ